MSPIEKNQLTKPYNFRIHYLSLFGRPMDIAAMARPNCDANLSCKLSEVQVCQYLADVEHRTVLIGLFQESFQSEAEKAGLTYYFMPIKDFPGPNQPIPCETYDQLYDIIKRETDAGRKVTLHCGAGDGRSGTVLAALKLREIITSMLLKDRGFLKAPAEKTEKVHLAYGGDSLEDCTPLVKIAIESIRKNRRSEDGDNGIRSVETSNDVLTLMEYEKHLKNMFLKRDFSITLLTFQLNKEKEILDRKLQASHKEIAQLEQNLTWFNGEIEKYQQSVPLFDKKIRKIETQSTNTGFMQKLKNIITGKESELNSEEALKGFKRQKLAIEHLILEYKNKISDNIALLEEAKLNLEIATSDHKNKINDIEKKIQEKIEDLAFRADDEETSQYTSDETMSLSTNERLSPEEAEKEFFESFLSKPWSAVEDREEEASDTEGESEGESEGEGEDDSEHVGPKKH